MNEIVTIGEVVGQPYGILWYALIPFVVVAGIGIAAAISENDGEMAAGGVIGGFVLSGITVVIMLFTMGNAYTNDVRDARTAALEQAGYTEVKVDDTDFTAVKDGQRVVGLLSILEDDTNRAQVIIIPPVS